MICITMLKLEVRQWTVDSWQWTVNS